MTRIPLLICMLIFSVPVAFTHCDRLRQESGSVDSIYTSYDHDLVPYLLYQADTTFTLDKILNEASALASLPDGRLATVEDENGIVFILNNEGQIADELEFGKDGDFEGLEYYNGQYFVLESNGDIHVFDEDDPEGSRESYETEFKGKNDLEGLAMLHGNLLIACKGDGEAGDYEPDGKAVYMVDRTEFKIRQVVLDVDEKELENLLRQRHKSIDVHDFDPSAVAVNPVDDRIYLLSADMMLAVFSPDGMLVEVVPLQARVFRQPEGITFMPDGTMYIVSEASGDQPRLFRFSRK